MGPRLCSVLFGLGCMFAFIDWMDDLLMRHLPEDGIFSYGVAVFVMVVLGVFIYSGASDIYLDIDWALRRARAERLGRR